MKTITQIFFIELSLEPRAKPEHYVCLFTLVSDLPSWQWVGVFSCNDVKHVWFCSRARSMFNETT